MHSFEVITEVKAPNETLFDLARDMDVHKKSQKRFKEEAIAGVVEGLIGRNESVTFRAIHFGLPFKMTSKITEFDLPDRFVDEQQKGPFRSFRHVHLFEVQGDGTRMVDEISFVAPLGLIGRLVGKLFLNKYLEELIVRRGQFLKEEAEARSSY